MANFPKWLMVLSVGLPLVATAQVDPEERTQAGGERNLGKQQEHEKYMLPAVHGTSASERLSSWQKHLQLLGESPFGGVKWRSVGPESQGGRVIDIDAPASNPRQMFVSFATGGLWT
ncbi:MAG: hypothetical protein IT203_09985, partial [Fimbriimonadaceae bacterium]|nr:hypothetical protein [Fimbriimonadaceae bacterium]